MYFFYIHIPPHTSPLIVWYLQSILLVRWLEEVTWDISLAVKGLSNVLIPISAISEFCVFKVKSSAENHDYFNDKLHFMNVHSLIFGHTRYCTLNKYALSLLSVYCTQIYIALH